jgi:ketosteroid isomerase-like protein
MAMRLDELGDSETQNRKTVLALYAATGRGDWAKAATLMTDDVLITESSTVPFAGVYRGVRAMRELFAAVQATGVVGIDMHAVTAGGDWVVVLLDLLFEGVPRARVPLAEAFRLNDGKVCEIMPYYFDPAPIVKAAQAGRSARP